MPQSVDESLEIGLYAPVILPALEQLDEAGLELEVVESEAELTEDVTEGKYVAGIALPADIMESLISGQKPKVKVYFASDVAEEIKSAVEFVIQELAYQQTGQVLAIEISAEILGPDMMGTQIPPRDRMRPLFAVMLLVFETMGLASLISEEIEQRTAQALLVTPMTVKDFFAAKAITGIIMAFVQAVLFMTIVGGMNHQPLIMLTTLLLGAVLVTGCGFIIAALGKDFMSVLVSGIVVFIILLIPSFGILFPGAVTDWVRAIPSHYLVDTVHRTANFGAGWGDIWYNLLILVGFDLALAGIGIMTLRRKLQ